MGRQITTIPPRTMELLTNHPWRGNVRELANFIERAVALSLGEELKVPAGELTVCHWSEITSISTFQQAERNAIVNALKASSGRIAGAAERLGLRRTTLQNKMQKLNICRADHAAQ
jgi:formate hydrogenlyase transcriptional activator